MVKGEIELKFCKTEDQQADISTKSISHYKFLLFEARLGVPKFSGLKGVLIKTF